jgi:hypothetical protein
MKMVSEQRIAASRGRVWEALNDPEILRASIPGCQSLDKETEHRFTATVDIKVGPIGARFRSAVSLADLDPPNGYTLNLEGQAGIAGSVKGSAKVRLREDAGATLISYAVDAQVGGRMAQLGGPIIEAAAKQIAGKFFNRLGEIVGGTTPTEPAGSKRATSVKPADTRKPAGVLPVAWVAAVVAGAIGGFFVGRGAANVGSDWAGIAIGLIVIVVAGAAFEYGRRAQE